MATIKVTTLKGFLNGAKYVGRGKEIDVSETRARNLEANKLVTRKAPDPKNKQAPKPTNKSKEL